MNAPETMVLLDGPPHVLDVVYETIDAHLQRTGEEYAQVITGVGTEQAGNVGYKEESVIHLYLPASMDREEAREQIEGARDRIAAERNMAVARQNVHVTVEEEEAAAEV